MEAAADARAAGQRACPRCVTRASLRSWILDARDEGFKILNIEEPWRVPGSICVFLASFESTSDIYEQFAVVLPRARGPRTHVQAPAHTQHAGAHAPRPPVSSSSHTQHARALSFSHMRRSPSCRAWGQKCSK